MVISFDNLSKGTTTSTNTKTFSHTVGTGDNTVLFVGTMQIGVDTITGVTFNGIPMTYYTTYIGSFRPSRIYYLVNPPVGTYNVVISASTTNTMDGVAVSYFGVDQTTPVIGHTTYSASSTTSISKDLTTISDNSWVAWWIPDSSGGRTYTSTSGDSVRLTTDAGGKNWIDTGSAVTPEGLNTMSASINASTILDSIMFEIKEFSATTIFPKALFFSQNM